MQMFSQLIHANSLRECAFTLTRTLFIEWIMLTMRKLEYYLECHYATTFAANYHLASDMLIHMTRSVMLCCY